jgi:hypothetical protein
MKLRELMMGTLLGACFAARLSPLRLEPARVKGMRKLSQPSNTRSSWRKRLMK